MLNGIPGFDLGSILNAQVQNSLAANNPMMQMQLNMMDKLLDNGQSSWHRHVADCDICSKAKVEDGDSALCLVGFDLRQMFRKIHLGVK